MKEKEALEYHAIQYFIAAYNLSHRRQLQFVELGQPPEPDALCLLNEQPLGIEVAHLYGSSLDAERILGHQRRRQLTEKEEQANRLIPLRQRVLAQLNKTLSDKSGKQYSRGPVWLLVRNGFPLWTQQEFDQHRSEIIVPEHHPYEQTWLLDKHDGKLLLMH